MGPELSAKHCSCLPYGVVDYNETSGELGILCISEDTVFSVSTTFNEYIF